MLLISCGLRIYTRRGAPVIVMTATAIKKEITEVVDMLVLRTRPVVLWASPVQPYQKYSVVRRPANCRGMLGSLDRQGRVVPGLWHLLHRLYLKQFLAGVKKGVPAKRAIIYFKNNSTLGAVYSFLQEVTGQTDPSKADFAMNHSSLLPYDDLVLEQRRDEITLYLASNKMLLGTDLSNIDMVIMCSPYDQPAAILQAAGRMSRRTSLPYRTAGQLYLLFNGSDLTSSNKNMSSEVRRLCREGSTTCTRGLLEEVFRVDMRQVGTSPVEEEGERDEEEEVLEKMEEKETSSEFQLLQKRIGDCRDHAQLLRLLQSSATMRQVMATSTMEEGNSQSSTRGEGGEVEVRHCCHKHDVQ